MGPSAAGMLPSSIQEGIYKLNRRQAREGALGRSVSRKGTPADLRTQL